MRTAAIFGIVTEILALADLTALLAVAAATHMDLYVRATVLGGQLVALFLLMALTSRLLAAAPPSGRDSAGPVWGE